MDDYDAPEDETYCPCCGRTDKDEADAGEFKSGFFAGCLFLGSLAFLVWAAVYGK